MNPVELSKKMGCLRTKPILQHLFIDYVERRIPQESFCNNSFFLAVKNSSNTKD